jgi:signal transduction histidine kinase/CheY-like chemotaxis protein/HPt (histidine-containing phosphotransfer) domain-containing protein
MTGTLPLPPLVLLAAASGAGGLSPLALSIGGVLVLALGGAIGWAAHHTRARRKAAAPADTLTPEKLIELLAFPAAVAEADGHWRGANRFADQFFSSRNLSSEEISTSDLVVRIRKCARTGEEDDSIELQLGELWIGWRISRLPDGSVLALPADITMQKQHEAIIARERDTALHAARMTSEFIATLSHDIRVPMNGVLGMANLLIESGIGPQQLELARSVVESAESIITLTDELLDLAKIEAGKLEITPQPVDLCNLLEELLRGHAARAAEKGIDLFCDIDPMLPAQIRTDPVRLRQILGNLLSNALKFTDRGEVHVHIGFESSPDNPNVGEMRFYVRDTGIGIPQEKRDHLFKAFSQADATTYSLYGGTGLGLATSRRVAELMNGRLWFDSDPGQGSTFHLALPYEPIEGSKPPIWTQKHIQVDGRDILILEDNQRVGALLRDWIARWGGRPRVIDNPADLIPWLEAGGRCSVALVDLDLPHGNGLAALRTLAQQKSPPRLVVLAARPPEPKHGIERLDILLKPIFPEPLLECLRRPARPAQPKPAERPAANAHPPAAPVPPPAAAPAPAPKQPATPRARVIVADDDLVNQKVMRTYLERLGCEVRLASNGVEALTVLAAAPCDVLFLDIMMPRMDGMQTVKEIRRHEAAEHEAGRAVRRLPIVAITAKVMPGDREAGLAAGFDDYATKPINDTRLRESLQKFIPGFQSAASLAAATPLLSQQQTPLIERSRLDELSSGDPDTAREIVALFFERMEALLPDLERTLAAKDFEEARRHAHTGAGSSATCGMMQAQNVMRRLERSIEAGQLDHTTALIAEARKVLAATRAAVDEMLPN